MICFYFASLRLLRETRLYYSILVTNAPMNRMFLT